MSCQKSLSEANELDRRLLSHFLPSNPDALKDETQPLTTACDSVLTPTTNPVEEVSDKASTTMTYAFLDDVLD